jgi:hypothetical protein
MRERTPNRRGSLAPPERGGPVEVGREIEVAEAEPGVGRPHPTELLGRAESLVGATPSPLPVHQPGEPVQNGVDVRGDPEPVHLHVVGRVHDHRDVLRRDGADEAAEELPGADAACERGDLHALTIATHAPATAGRSKAP